jgi:GNAT superfamily N-acetyltransferase
MEDMIEVRPATRDDIDALCDAHVEAWRVGYRGLFADEYLDAESFDATRRKNWHVGRWIGHAEQVMLAGAIDGRVLGFAHSGPERIDDGEPLTGRGEVFGFYLHPDAWGSGLAAALMSSSEDALRQRGYTEAVLWVLRDNPRARSFYEKAGWTWGGREMLWAGPQMPGVPKPDPIAEVQYVRVLS